MSDAFVPEADRLDQQRDVVDDPIPTDDHPPSPAPRMRSPEASEADVLDQSREVVDDEGYDAY